jgi:hypothetical protein
MGCRTCWKWHSSKSQQFSASDFLFPGFETPEQVVIYKLWHLYKWGQMFLILPASCCALEFLPGPENRLTNNYRKERCPGFLALSLKNLVWNLNNDWAPLSGVLIEPQLGKIFRGGQQVKYLLVVQLQKWYLQKRKYSLAHSKKEIQMQAKTRCTFFVVEERGLKFRPKFNQPQAII